MTKEQKKQGRDLRHKLQRAVEKNHFSPICRLHITPAQLRASARKVTDQILAGKLPGTAVLIQPRRTAAAA